MGNEDLGKHLESIGDLNAAAEAFSKMRPDVSTSKQFIDVGRHLVRVSVQRCEWAMVSAHLSKMGGSQSQEEEFILQPYIKIAHGIALLGQEKYHEAALSFLAADSAASSSNYNELASANDVAIYGGLLALASMDRSHLQQQVLENPKFRTFLELEPHIRRAIAQFVSGRYSACIAILESYRPDYLLDIYLQKHIQTIYAQIRSKCIVQYMIPFSCVSLDTMNKAFGRPGQPIEDELADMIQSGILQARINTIDKVSPRVALEDMAHANPRKLVTTIGTNPRVQMQEAALKSAEDYERQALDRLWRMGISAADLELKGQKKMGGHPLHGHGELAMEETLG